MEKLKFLTKVIQKAWGKDTCYPPSAKDWTQENPAFGQCAITALIVQDYYSGNLLYCEHNHHYWNELPNNKEVDLSESQFKHGVIVCKDEVRSREYVLNSKAGKEANTPVRYRILKQRIKQNLPEDFTQIA